MVRADEGGSASASSKTETSARASATRVLSAQHEIADWQADAYRALHRHPELAHQEVRTAAAAAGALRDAGFEVHDIGVDQSVEKFMAAADKCQPTIVGMSALLTTTMTYMKTVIDGFEAAGRGHIKMAVGGAPISQMFADEIGADGYGQNASAAVDLFLRLARQGSAPGVSS